MSDSYTNLSGRYNVNDENKVIDLAALSKRGRGSIWNRGDETIFIAFNKSTVTSTNVDAEIVDEDYLLSGESMRLPVRTNKITVKCATDKTSKFSYIED